MCIRDRSSSADPPEEVIPGCANLRFSCADRCPGPGPGGSGEYPWMSVYRKSRAKERALYEACSVADGDTTRPAAPTADWEPAKPGGRYAVVLAGGMRNFIATGHSWQSMVIDASGGSDNVDLFFHVWDDESQRVSHPETFFPSMSRFQLYSVDPRAPPLSLIHI